MTNVFIVENGLSKAPLFNGANPDDAVVTAVYTYGPEPPTRLHRSNNALCPWVQPTTMEP
jgi:hypothetical protein